MPPRYIRLMTFLVFERNSIVESEGMSMHNWFIMVPDVI